MAVEKGIPIPLHNNSTGATQALRELLTADIGDSVVIKCTRNNISTLWASVGGKSGNYTARVLDNGFHRVWKTGE